MSVHTSVHGRHSLFAIWTESESVGIGSSYTSCVAEYSFAE